MVFSLKIIMYEELVWNSCGFCRQILLQRY